ncbi:MAG: hypothetical protein ACTSXA_10485 [Candidatus Heimdallarchaeota archaeon]
MKGKREKISVMFLFIILLGADVANIQVLSSISPKDATNPIDFTVVKQVESQFMDNELGYRLTLEVYTFLQKVATDNNFQITSTVFSAALLIENEDLLIIIGHGHFDIKGNYFIGTYSVNQIQQFAAKKKFVALLACFSVTVQLENAIQLVYSDTVTIKTAINDLIRVLNWESTFVFNPSINFSLFDLDSGYGGMNPAYSNGIKYAYTGYDIGYYWDLNTEAGFLGVGNWMMAHKGILVKVYISNNYYEQIAENTWQLISGVISYDAWVIRKSDLGDYLHIENLVVYGDTSKKKYDDIKIKSIKDVLENDVFWAGAIITFAVALATILTQIGILLLKNRITYRPILITVTALGESVLGIPAGPYIFTIPTINTCAVGIGITLIIIAVIIIAAGLTYAIYNLCN